MTTCPDDASSAARRRRGWIIRSGGVLVAVAALVCLAVSQADIGTRRKDGGESARSKGAAAVIPVATAIAEQADLPVYLEGLGTVTALNSVTIRSRVDGELLQVHFAEGQQVRKGDLLAEIDPRPFQAQLAQAEGQLARDQALLDNARADLQRYQVLLQQDSIATQQVAGQSALVRQYEASIKVDKGQIAAIKLQLEYCRIVAPVDGRAGLRLVDPGNYVRANDTSGLVVISQTEPIAAVFTLAEDRLPTVMAHLRPGGHPLAVEAYDRSGANRLAEGTLLAVDNQIDPATGTVKLKAVFSNVSGVLFANQFVNVRMNLDPLRNATVIPAAAVQRGAQGDFAYVVNDGRARMQTLRLGPKDGERVAVLDGLQAGAQVVVEGTDRLRDGQAVQVVTADADRKEVKTVLADEPENPAASSKRRKERPE